jgi:hypothetical protein
LQSPRSLGAGGQWFAPLKLAEVQFRWLSRTFARRVGQPPLVVTPHSLLFSKVVKERGNGGASRTGLKDGDGATAMLFGSITVGLDEYDPILIAQAPVPVASGMPGGRHHDFVGLKHLEMAARRLKRAWAGGQGFTIFRTSGDISTNGLFEVSAIVGWLKI